MSEELRIRVPASSGSTSRGPSPRGERGESERQLVEKPPSSPMTAPSPTALARAPIVQVRGRGRGRGSSPRLLSGDSEEIVSRDRSNALGDRLEWQPLKQVGGMVRRNSLAPTFTGDPVLRMVQLLCDCPFFIEYLAHKVDATEVQKLADAIVNISVPFQRTLFLVKQMIKSEFLQNKSQVSSIMRGNCAASKLMGAFSFFIGKPFLEQRLGQYVRDIVALGDGLSLEVDPTRESSAEKRARNRKELLGYTERLVELITDAKRIEEIPAEIRLICKFTADDARETCPDNLNQLVGGYLILRLINPVLVAPEAYGISSVPPGLIARRNLTLISKLLQNISNGVVSASKEPYMADFAEVVAAQHAVFVPFLAGVVAAAEDTTSKPSIPVEEADVGFIEGKHLAFLLAVLHGKVDDMQTALMALQRNVKTELEMMSIVKMIQQEHVANTVAIPKVQSMWLSHYYAGISVVHRKKKRKVPVRLELTRFFLYFCDDVPAGQTVTAENVRKAVPLSSIHGKLKQKSKKDILLSLTYYDKEREFSGESEALANWGGLFTSAHTDTSNPQMGNDRFISKVSKGVIADVLTAHWGYPRLAYTCQIKTEKPRNAARKLSQTDTVLVVVVSAFDCTWEVPISLMQVTATVERLGMEVEGKVLLPPIPNVLFKTREENSKKDKDALDFSLQFDLQGNASRGVHVLRDYFGAFLQACQTSPLISHSRALLDLLQLSSPFRAGTNGLDHLRWIHRYIVGGLALKKRGNNVLMQLIEENSHSDSETVEMIKFLVDSKAVNVKDVDSEGNSVLHRAFKVKSFIKALTLCEMGLVHTRNKHGQYPIHVALSVLEEGVEPDLQSLEACIKGCVDGKNQDQSIMLSFDDKGKSPLHLAVSSGKEDVTLLVLEAIEYVAGSKKPLSNPGKAQYLQMMLERKMLEALFKAIEFGLFDLSETDSDGQTFLHRVVLAGDLKLLMELVQKVGAEQAGGLRDKDQITLLHCAGQAGNVEMMNVLLPISDVNAKDKSGRSLFHFVASSGKEEAVSMLLLKGLSPDAIDGDNVSPLLLACRKGHVDVAKALIRANASVLVVANDGETCMHAAASAKSAELCKLLASSGAEAQAKALDKSKKTPLWCCVENSVEDEGLDTVDFLCSVGASASVQDASIASILHVAAQRCSAGVVGRLIKHGADPNAMDLSGNTPLHLACTRGVVGIVEALVAGGAQPGAKNAVGETPLGLAVSAKKKDIIMVFANVSSAKMF